MRTIDADALMPKLKFIREAEHQIYGKESWGFAGKCITAIEDAPTIEERKKGKWIVYETENERYVDIKCPFCKKTYTVDAYRIDDIGFTAEDLRFCPNCGADLMEGETE